MTVGKGRQAGKGREVVTAGKGGEGIVRDAYTPFRLTGRKGQEPGKGKNNSKGKARKRKG